MSEIAFAASPWSLPCLMYTLSMSHIVSLCLMPFDKSALSMGQTLLMRATLEAF